VKGAATVKGRSATVDDSIPPAASKARAGFTSTSKGADYYKPLKTHFQRGEFNYKQIAREKDVAIFEQTWRGRSEPSVCWEVAVIRRHNGKTIKRHWVAPSEFYPSSTEWGKYGFTLINKDTAFAKLREIAALFNAPARFGQKRKRNLLEKSPT
jgi:hypothetical protein